MGYDIFGETLKRGYCEFHPDIPEEYPCYFCRSERRKIDSLYEEQYRLDEEYYNHYCIEQLWSAWMDVMKYGPIHGNLI